MWVLLPMQPPLWCKPQAVSHMTQDVTQVVQDDEDQMSAALTALRADRAEEPVSVIDSTPAPAAVEEVEEPQATQEEPAEAEAPAKVDPAEQLKTTQAELHKMRSEIGRVSALNHKYMQAAQEAAALREQLAQVQQRPAQPESTEVIEDRLAAVAEQVKDFPELAGIVSAVSDALKQADRKTEEVARRVAAQVVEPLEPLRREQNSRLENEQKAAYDAALVTFNSTYPTAAQVVRSDEFATWLAIQPGHIQYAFSKGQTPDEAMSVLDTYDMHLRRSGKEPIAQFNQSQSEQQTPPPARSAVNTNRLQRAAGLPSRAAGSQGSAPPSDDFDASLAYFRNKRLAAAARAAA
jgi:hypothetical protein